MEAKSDKIATAIIETQKRMASQMTNKAYPSIDRGLVSFPEFPKTRRQQAMLEHVLLDLAGRSEHPMSLPLETIDQVILNRLAEAYSPEMVYLDD